MKVGSIILIDDSDMTHIRNSISEEFGDFDVISIDGGHRIDLAELFGIIRQTRARVIILDYEMPKSTFNGVSLLAAIRSEFPLLASIVFTGQLSMWGKNIGELKKCIDMHLDFLIEKGDIDDIADTIKKITHDERFAFVSVISDLCESSDKDKPILKIGDETLSALQIRDRMLFGSPDQQTSIRRGMLEMIITINSWLLTGGKK